MAVDSDVLMFWSARRGYFQVFSLRPWHRNHQHLCELMLQFGKLGFSAEVVGHAVRVRNA